MSHDGIRRRAVAFAWRDDDQASGMDAIFLRVVSDDALPSTMNSTRSKLRVRHVRASYVEAPENRARLFAVLTDHQFA